ncbi:phospholipase D-like domain-containing protein [Ruegeria sp. 2205SS24-7]|uniref:phospholipase D-like domain-containing protein n=1 Tax=Ruegeria discodermiae TaxID=3064389 RepID=UPI0027425CC6|nr:phospholipase D-like domain-containing protein [Ruegeria sp. 2205SS24-7]MDP5218555.1 phospholipase D-like domain-containing protein [Ruegeria sp. 2205SS24-7]
MTSSTGWTWDLGLATDLPKKLKAAFPSTARGAAGATEPVVRPLAIVNLTGVSTGFVYPFTGPLNHHQNGTTHWVWGRAADPARHPALLALLTLGNPLIALRFTDPTVAASDAFPSEGQTSGTAIELTSGTAISVDGLSIVAAYPLAPGLDTLAVLRDLRDKLTAAGIAETSFADLVTSMDSIAAPMRLLEPSGTPVTGREVTLTHSGGTTTATLDTSHRGDILSATGIARSGLGAAPTLAIAAAGEEITARAPSGAAASGALPLTGTEAHIDFASLNEWFAPQGSTALQRFNRGCRVTPFINGPEFFDHLFTELHATTLPVPPGSPNPLLYLAGYAIDHSAKLASIASALPNRSLIDVTDMLSSDGAEARFLALQFMQLEPGFLDDVEVGARVAALILAIAGGIATFFQDSKSWDQLSFFGHTQALAAVLFFGAGSLNDILEKLEPNRGAIDALAALPGVEAHLDPYPAECPDNPACVPSNEFVSLVHGAQKRFNAFHQKIAVLRNDAGLHAYCGGIDLNPNRLDDRDHGRRAPYHDVHARVDGLAAGELARTFSERWAETGGTGLEIDTPGALAGLPTDGPDIVQVARTYFGPSATDASRALPYAATGERTILDTTLAAIRRARRYIYIEDQYLTPPLEYRAALVAAAAWVSGPLIIVVPETPDQPFGFAPRQNFIMDLEAAWGDRLKVGTMRGQFSRSQTNRTTAVGRLWLMEDVEDTGDEITVGPPSRVPDAPFWLVVDNEAMRVLGKAAATTTTVSVRLRVDRGDTTNLFDDAKGTKRAKHKKHTPATAGIFAGIYVHSKMMLIDDCFASIGSANLNRRGFYSDGECNIFALREDLAHGNNWIRELRTRLWSELAGVSESFGATAFADPSRNLDLFDRKFMVGNRFSPFAAQPYRSEFDVQADFTASSSKLAGLGFILKAATGMGQVIAGTNSEPLFDSFIDPSSEVAP